MTQEGKIPLHYAVVRGNLCLVTALLEKEVSLLQKSGKGTGSETKSLLVCTQDNYGDTPLHIAGRQGSKPIAKQLLNYGADKDILNQVSN